MTISHQTLVEYEDALSKSMLKYFLCGIWCLHSSTVSPQYIPGRAGFISETDQVPKRLTTIDYYPIINHLTTDYSTVQECLRVSSKSASRQFGQQYAVTIFRLGLCMKAYPIIWKSPHFYEYNDRIVMIGSFHRVWAYLKMMGKKMNESGLVDVLLEAGVIAVGFMNGLISGKNNNHAIDGHKVMAKSLERLLLDRYLETRCLKGLPGDLPQAIDHINCINNKRASENLDAAMQNKALTNFLEEYSLFRQQVRGWLTYRNHISLVLSLLYAVKINDYYLYGACLSKMVNLFFSFDGQNYVRYLCYFSLFLVNIVKTLPGATELLKLDALSVARSFISTNRCVVDKTIEEVFIQHAKSQAGSGRRGAGTSDLLNNYEAYRRRARTAHEKSRHVEVMLQMANIFDDGSGRKHRNFRPSQAKKSEKATSGTVKAIQNFMDPFQVEMDA